MAELILYTASILFLILVLRHLPPRVPEKVLKEAKAKEKKAEDKPETAEDKEIKADKLAEENKLKAAEKIYLALIVGNPQEARFYNKLGLVYLKDKAYKDARDALKQALTIEPDNDTFYNNLGLIDYQEGKFDEAVEAYEKSIDINNTVSSRFVNLGLAYYMQKKYRKAADAYEKALILEPANEEYRRLLQEVEEKLK
jgi:tetratricopeptide (TPR) repeat protein